MQKKYIFLGFSNLI